MSDARERIEALRGDAQRMRGRADALREESELESRTSDKAARDAVALDQATQVLQAATEARRLELHDRVEQLVTRGLRSIFGRQDLEFAFRVTLRADVFGVTPVVRSRFGDRVVETEIVDGHGGGVADVVSFLLRVVVLCLARPRAASFLALDETFRHVSLEYLRGCGAMLKELNRSVGIQFLLVTHKPELVDSADVVYRAENREGRTAFVLEHDLRDDSFHARPPRGATRVDERSAFAGEDLLEAPAPEDVDVVTYRVDAAGRRPPANKTRKAELDKERQDQ